MHRAIGVLWVAVILALAAAPRAAQAAIDIPFDLPRPRSAPAAVVLPAEFERQQAILIGWNSEDDFVQAAQAAVIAAIQGKVEIIVLVPADENRKAADEALKKAGVPRRGVHFVQLPIDTIWARDYGPLIVKAADGSGHVVDAHYGHADRPDDDDVPVALAPQLGLDTRLAPLIIDGGNLLSNGAGLCLTTEAIIEHNAPLGLLERQLTRLLRRHYGVRRLVILEPLAGEPTGHVDMFATFVSPRTVLVGEMRPDADPVNAAILDRNAARLAALRTPEGSLQVVRIPMPPCTGGTWRSYTNVLYANGVVLMPTYRGLDPAGEARARLLYRSLLPGWKLVTIDCSELIELGGAVHCLTMNLCRIEHPPGVLRGKAKPRAPRRLHPFADPDEIAGRSGLGDPFELPRAPDRNGIRGAAPGVVWKPSHRVPPAGTPEVERLLDRLRRPGK